MRKRQCCASNPLRITRKNPLEDNICSSRTISDRKMIARVLELREEGKKDWRIANIIGEETGRSPRAIEGQMRKLTKSGDLPQNENKQKKIRGNRVFLIEKRNELMGNGMCDGAIAKIISDETGKSLGSVKTTISAYVRKGTLEPNPNNQRTMDHIETKKIRKRREELKSIGLTDTSIARVLEVELKDRNANAIRRTLWELVGMGALEENTNSGDRTYEEVLIQRETLRSKGKTDKQIAGQIAKEREMLPVTINFLIFKAVKDGGCPKNRN
ncbi:MAG: hypothetical protein ABH983_02735 [Candidatus Micrarchaeota archaeon]